MNDNQEEEIRFATQVRAIDPKTGELSTFRGIDIYHTSIEGAQAWVDNNAGYFEIIGFYSQSGDIVELEKTVSA